MTTAAVATSDGKTVHKGHFGDAAQYYIYDLSTGTPLLVRKIDNPYHGHREHGHGETWKRRSLLELLGHPDYVVATFYGPGGEEFFKKNKVNPVKAKPGASIEEALESLLGKEG